MFHQSFSSIFYRYSTGLLPYQRIWTDRHQNKLYCNIGISKKKLNFGGDEQSCLFISVVVYLIKLLFCCYNKFLESLHLLRNPSQISITKKIFLFINFLSSKYRKNKSCFFHYYRHLRQLHYQFTEIKT